MLGNAFEWVADWHDIIYYESLQHIGSAAKNLGLDTRIKDPGGPAHANNRVLRGGSWNSYDWDVSASARNRAAPLTRRNDIGFRCAGELRDH